MPDGDIDVFISYKKEEADKAQRLLEALEAAGYSAVYDATGLTLNDNFADKLESLIRRARKVVVLWTEMSSASDWVRDEARLARDLDKYLGVVVEPNTDIALDLRNLHKIDLTRMDFAAGVDIIVTEIAKQLGPGSLTPAVLAEASFFRAVQADGSRGGYEAFLRAHPTGRYSEKAQQKLAELPRQQSVPAIAAISAAALMGAVGYLAAGLFGPQTMDTSQVVSLKEELKVAISTRDAAIAVKAKAQAEVGRLAEEVVSLTRQADAAEGVSNTIDGLNADVERLEIERDVAKVAEAEASGALAEALQRIAELEFDLASRTTPLRVETAQPDCRVSGENGIEILGECRPLSTSILSLSDRQMTDASPLSALTSLRRLFLVGTQIADVSPLSGLTSLRRLDVSGTQIKNFAPLRKLTNLHYLRTTKDGIIGSPSDSPESRKEVADYIEAHAK